MKKAQFNSMKPYFNKAVFELKPFRHFSSDKRSWPNHPKFKLNHRKPCNLAFKTNYLF